MAYCDIIRIKHPPTHGDFLDIKKIRVLGCKSYPDCTYIERVELIFEPCNNDGAKCGIDIGKDTVVTLDIETGYIPYSDTATALKVALISKVGNIRDIDILIKAFQYRKYYCRV